MPSPSRRSYLRAIGGSFAIGALGSVSGCLTVISSGPGSRLSTGLRTIAGAESFPKRELSSYVAEMRDAYSDHGLWGHSTATPMPDDTEFVGVWVNSSEEDLQADFGRWDHAAVLYRIGRSNVSTRYRLWLWSGVRSQQNTLFGEDMNLRKIEHELSLYGQQDLLDYAPKSRLMPGQGPASVGLDGDDVRFPLTSGKITLDDSETELGESAGFSAAWHGSHEGTQSMHSVFDIRNRRHDYPHEFSISLNNDTSQWGI